jgi:LmbE family N-acetylglucosaminyl deacetylase
MRAARDIVAGFEGLPLAGVTRVLGGCRPLVLAPHPDDESLGCGGMIAAACAAGLVPAVAILTDGAASHPQSRQYPPARLAGQREAEAREAVAILGLPADKLFFMREPDTKLAADGAVIERLLAIAAREDCGVVVGPWRGDPHCDHEAAAAIAEAIAIRLGARLLSYPVWGWVRDGDDMLAETRTQGWRLDITAQLDRKRRAIAAHVSQHGGLIGDSPGGFSLPAELLAVSARPYEVFLSQ